MHRKQAGQMVLTALFLALTKYTLLNFLWTHHVFLFFNFKSKVESRNEIGWDSTEIEEKGSATPDNASTEVRFLTTIQKYFKSAVVQ